METMKQTVKYNARLRLFVFYRGGYDLTNDKGLDPYFRDSNPIGTAKGYKPCYPIMDGIILFSGKESEDRGFSEISKFFFGEGFDSSKSQTVECQCMMCFDSVGRMVFWKKGDPAPLRVSKICKSRKGSFYKEWIAPYTQYGESTPPVEVRGLKFKKNQQYLVLSFPRHIMEILPEYGYLHFTFDKYVNSENWKKELEKVSPIDLSDSWDYTEDEKKEIDAKVRKIKEEQERARAELEERKVTPGYCDCCGEPAAYVVDPYQEEMYGYRSKRWLCSSCYDSLLGDI